MLAALTPFTVRAYDPVVPATVTPHPRVVPATSALDACVGADAVVMLAAVTPDKGRGPAAFMTNIRMGAAVCAALEKVELAHVVYVSSDAVYGAAGGLLSETSCAEPGGRIFLSRHACCHTAIGATF